MKRIGPLITKLKNEDNNYNSNYSTTELYNLLTQTVESHWKILENNFQESIIPELNGNGIYLESYTDLSNLEKKDLTHYFRSNIYPILTPLAVDSGHPFPFLSNLSKSIAVCLRQPKSKEKNFARLKIPNEIDQWIQIPAKDNKKYRFISLDELIINNLSMLFNGMKIEHTMLFRVTRNATISDEGDETDDLLEMVEEGLKERKFAPIVRFEYEDTKDEQWNMNFLMSQLEIPKYATSAISNKYRYLNFSKILELPLSELKYRPFQAIPLISLAETTQDDHTLFTKIKNQDILAHFPYNSFKGSIEHLLNVASEDPNVMAIKMTLYRTDADGKLINILLKAAENKKQVAVIVELTARFDEEKNIQWAQTLEDAGVHVSYGLAHLKTHAKLILIIRKEELSLKSYLNISTGNFNSSTSKLYTDLSLFTCDDKLASEVIEVFNYLTGRSLGGSYQELLVAPFNMHTRFAEMIDNEIKNAKKGKSAHIMAKMNSLHDKIIIEQLYKASQAGVQIQLIVRGFCCLRPGVKGLSENIRVYSLVGRLLEHSRIFYFLNGKEDPVAGKFYIGSADWMQRNLYDRVEVICPIYNKDLKRQCWDILNLTLKDNRHLWQLKPNGKYIQIKERSANKLFNSQNAFIEKLKE